MMRNYYNGFSEYCLYYTFQTDSGDIKEFKSLRDYFKNIQLEIGLNKKQIIDKIGQRADHCFRHSSSQWDLPTEETYNELIKLGEEPIKIISMLCKSVEQSKGGE